MRRPRTRRSCSPDDAKERARAAYDEALRTAQAAHLDGLAIDAIHMLGFVDTSPADQLRWAQEALAVVEASTQADAKKWEASIRNNVGYALYQLGRYVEALQQFNAAVTLRERGSDTGATRVAYWMVAWTLRAMKRNDEALKIQLRLEREGDAGGRSGPVSLRGTGNVVSGGWQPRARSVLRESQAGGGGMTPGVDSGFVGSIPQIYERYLVPLIFEPYAADLARRVVSAAPKRVLEIAAGTGVVTRRLAASLPDDVAIVATDLNQPMLDVAAAAGTAREVEWQRADALSLPFADASFDAVVCQFSVMFFPDKGQSVLRSAPRAAAGRHVSVQRAGIASKTTNSPIR
jgi:hypothetical protein